MRRIMIIAIVGLGLTTSCKKHISEGALSTEDRVLTDSISGIRSKGAFDVFITQDTSYDIRVEAGERVLPYIETYVDNHTLIINERWNQYIGNKPKRVFVSAYYLNSIHLDGSGNIHADHLHSTNGIVELDGSGNISINYDALSSVAVDLSGSGNVDLEGTCSNAVIELSGSGNVDTRGITTLSSTIDVEGSGNVKITVTDDLTGSISGSGNIYYWGNPPLVSTSITGSGNIIEM